MGVSTAPNPTRVVKENLISSHGMNSCSYHPSILSNFTVLCGDPNKTTYIEGELCYCLTLTSVRHSISHQISSDQQDDGDIKVITYTGCGQNFHSTVNRICGALENNLI